MARGDSRHRPTRFDPMGTSHGADLPDHRDLGGRVEEAGWDQAIPGLAKAVAGLDELVANAHLSLADRAVVLAQPGLVDPRRLVRHAAAASVSRVVRTTTQLPDLLTNRRPLNDPQGWLLDTAIEAFVDQLVLAGAAGAELGRLIEGAGSLFPDVLRAELARRDLTPVPVPIPTVQAELDAAIGPPGTDVPITVVTGPITRTPVSQLHRVETADGRLLFARARRPRIAWALDHDAKLASGAAVALQRLAPEAGGMGMGPLGFVRLIMRQTLESTDLRYEALDLVELGLVVARAGRPGLRVLRPSPLRLAERAVTLEHADGVALTSGAHVAPEAAAALMGITLESALAEGLFWADPAPEHLLVAPDGSLVLAGVGTLGRFSPALRLAGVRTIKGVLTGDFEGMIEGMAIAGAITPDVDVTHLLADLGASDALNPMQILMGGQSGLLDALSTVVRLMLANKLEPPVEVILLLRTVFSLGRLVDIIDPGGPGLAGALMELMPRLPQLIADAEADFEI